MINIVINKIVRKIVKLWFLYVFMYTYGNIYKLNWGGIWRFFGVYCFSDLSLWLFG